MNFQWGFIVFHEAPERFSGIQKGFREFSLKFQGLMGFREVWYPKISGRLQVVFINISERFQSV